MDTTERWQALKQKFLDETGVYAPGEDSPIGDRPIPDQAREEAWRLWLKKVEN